MDFNFDMAWLLILHLTQNAYLLPIEKEDNLISSLTTQNLDSFIQYHVISLSLELILEI